MLEVGVRVGINYLKAGQINLQPSGAVHDLLLLADHDQVRSSLFEDLRRSDKGSLIGTLRKNDGLLVLSCFFLH